MLVAPVVDVVGEDVGAHAQRRHAPVLGGRGELAVLHRVTVVPAGMALEHRLHSVDEHLRGLVAVAVAMHRQPRPVVGLHQVGHLVGRGQPQAVADVARRRPVVVRPADAGREALDRPVQYQLHDAEAQLVGLLALQMHAQLGQLGGVRRAAEQVRHGHHHPSRIRRVAGDLAPVVELAGVPQLGGAEVGEQRVAGVAGLVGVAPAGLLGAVGHHHVHEGVAGQHHPRRLVQLAVGQAVAAAGHAGAGGVLVDAAPLHQRRVDGGQVAAGMQYQRGPVAGDRVEMTRHQPFAGEIDGVEAPCQQRLRVVGQIGGGLAEPFEHVVDGGAARPQPPLRVAPVEVADVGGVPQPARHHMAVRLHEPRHQHVLREAPVHPVIAPRRQLVDAAHAQNPAARHRDRLAERKRRIDRDDPPRRVDHKRLPP